MNLRAREQVALEFHAQVKANCSDSLSSALLLLHQPVIVHGQPRCQGCDPAPEATNDPAWPCRTYELIAATVLAESPVDKEVLLLGLEAHAERQQTRPAADARRTGT